MIRRRDFIAGIGSAVAWPMVAQARQATAPVIGFLSSQSAELDYKVVTIPFLQGLKETGYVEGQNVAVEYRYAENQLDRLPTLAADLVRRRVAVIAVPSAGTALAAKAATATIPIVFNTGGDKRLELLHDLLPQATRFAVLVDKNQQTASGYSTNFRTAASTRGWQTEIFAASTSSDIDAAFAGIAQKRTDALFVAASSFFRDRIVQFTTLAARHAVPAIFVERAYSEAGGLISYGANLLDQTRLSGAYVGRILKGEKPADLPVQQAARIELIINLQTARILGLTVPETLLATADEVIQKGESSSRG